MADKTTLRSCPLELLEAFADNVDRKGLLALRLVCKDFATAADRRFLQDYFTYRGHLITVDSLEARRKVDMTRNSSISDSMLKSSEISSSAGATIVDAIGAMDAKRAIKLVEIQRTLCWVEGKRVGAGLQLTGAALHPRFDIITKFIITKFLNNNDFVRDCDLVITAEGSIDEETPKGNIAGEVAHLAKARGVPVIALAGTVGVGAEVNYQAGIDAYAFILQGPVTLQVAIAQAERLLTDAAESVMSMVMVGWSLKKAIAPIVGGKADSNTEVKMMVRRARTSGC